jgi:hypothetical protein
MQHTERPQPRKEPRLSAHILPGKIPTKIDDNFYRISLANGEMYIDVLVSTQE